MTFYARFYNENIRRWLPRYGNQHWTMFIMLPKWNELCKRDLFSLEKKKKYLSYKICYKWLDSTDHNIWIEWFMPLVDIWTFSETQWYKVVKMQNDISLGLSSETMQVCQRIWSPLLMYATKFSQKIPTNQCSVHLFWAYSPGTMYIDHSSL